jgi:hypothetical protein
MAAFSTMLMAYTDNDMDGVDDAVDKCPNTPLMDLVDINGCTKKVLIPKVTKQHFDIIIGASYSGSNFSSLNQTDTYATTLQADYYYGNFSLQGSTSYYKTDASDYSENGMNDSFLGAAYNIKPLKDLLVRIGVGAVLATYKTDLNNNKTDYTGSLNLSYTVGKVNLFGGYIYTMINDDDVILTDANGDPYTYSYQNTNAVSLGAGYYFTNTFYMSASYNTADSIYKDVEDIRSASLYAYKTLNKNWFVTLFYAYGLSDSASDHAASVKLGYYF